MTSSFKIVDEGTERYLRLTLRAADGRAWHLVVSHSTAQFIGRYARLPEMREAGPILHYATVSDGASEAVAPPWPAHDD